MWDLFLNVKGSALAFLKQKKSCIKKWGCEYFDVYKYVGNPFVDRRRLLNFTWVCEESLRSFGKGSVQAGPFTEAMQRRAAVPSLAPQGRLFTGETSDRCTIILQQQKTLPAKDQAAEAALVALSTSQSGL